jgi:hypothetical protein
MTVDEHDARELYACSHHYRTLAVSVGLPGRIRTQTVLDLIHFEPRHLQDTRDPQQATKQQVQLGIVASRASLSKARSEI